MSSIKLVCTDIDNTVYGDIEASRRFHKFWEELGEETRPILCFNSGRLIDDQLDLLNSAPLPRPRFIIGGVGTAIFDSHHDHPVDGYADRLNHQWDIEIVQKVVAEFPGTMPQPGHFQTQFKSSWYLHNASEEQIAELRSRIAETGVQATVIYSSARDLDVLPSRADKGDALVWLCEHLEIDLTHVVVAGDTGNDSRMFEVPGVRGIVVGNAMPELIAATADLPVFRATAAEADGVIEGLKHFGLMGRS